MPVISLDYTLTSGSTNKTGQITAQVSGTTTSQEEENLLKLLDQIFVMTNYDSQYELYDYNLNQDFIIGLFDAVGQNYQGFATSAEATTAKTSLTNFITDNALTGVSVAVNSAAATIVFTKNSTNTGTNNLPLDYFNILSQFVSNNDSAMNLKGYSKAVLDSNTITFKTAAYINVTKPAKVNASYISVD